MSRTVHAYRPQRTRADLLEETSIGREPLVSEIVKRLARWSPGASRQHYLLIGPRGIGKTHLLRLVEHRLQSNPDLEARWAPIALAEDVYSITRISDLLLEMLRILGEDRRVADAEGVYRAIRHDDDDARVIDRCLDAFRRFHRQTGRGVLLMIENLDRLLERQIRDRTESHRLRKILLEEDWLVTICTSPTYLNAVTNEQDPFFEFFQIHALAELTAAEQEEMLRKLAAADGDTTFDVYLGELRSRLRALYHFTGGNPRLTVMLYDLLAHKRVRNVRNELDLLLDQLTPFYQDRMKEISELEAKVLAVMTLLPEGCAPSELAQEARLAPKVVRATLTRLERAGHVRREQRRHKRTVYIVPERLFRIWHQMNHSRTARGRIQYLLEFFSSWYSNREERDRVWDELTEAFYRGTEKDVRKGVRTVIRGLDDQASNVRGSAVTALGCIADLKVVEPLIRALSDPAHSVRGSAAAALGRIADFKVIAPLVSALGDPASDVRASAAIALGRIAENLRGPALRRTLRVLVHSSPKRARPRLPSVLQILLRVVFRTADLDSIRESLQEVKAVFSWTGLWRPYETALEYLSLDRDPAILEKQQPEMREAVLLLVDLFDQGARAGSSESRIREELQPVS